jgi:hypothetical protein
MARKSAASPPVASETRMSPAPRVALREAYERCSIMDAPLAERLAAYSGAVREHFPAYAKAVDKLVARLRGSSAGENAPQPGSPMPPFVLPDELKQIPVKVVHNLHAESTPHIGLLGGS